MHEQDTPKLSPEELAYCTITSQLTLARIQGDHEMMDLLIEQALELLTVKQIIGAIVTELAVIVQTEHGSPEAAGKYLTDLLARISLEQG